MGSVVSHCAWPVSRPSGLLALRLLKAQADRALTLHQSHAVMGCTEALVTSLRAAAPSPAHLCTAVAHRGVRAHKRVLPKHAPCVESCNECNTLRGA